MNTQEAYEWMISVGTALTTHNRGKLKATLEGLATSEYTRGHAQGYKVARAEGRDTQADLLEACEGLLRLCQCLALLYYGKESEAKEIGKAEKAIAKAKAEK